VLPRSLAVRPARREAERAPRPPASPLKSTPLKFGRPKFSGLPDSGCQVPGEGSHAHPSVLSPDNGLPGHGARIERGSGRCQSTVTPTDARLAAPICSPWRIMGIRQHHPPRHLRCCVLTQPRPLDNLYRLIACIETFADGLLVNSVDAARLATKVDDASHMEAWLAAMTRL
jgi:hypothetical protein